MIGAELEALLARLVREQIKSIFGITDAELNELDDAELRERAQSRIAAMRARSTKGGAR